MACGANLHLKHTRKINSRNFIKYRKRPIIIEAEQWLFKDFVDGKKIEGVYVEANRTGEKDKIEFRAWVSTLQGAVPLYDGDWIISGLEGEKYPCNPKIFEQVYEKVEE